MISYLFKIIVDLFVVVMVLQYFFAQVGYESFVGTELDLTILISGRDASGYNCGFGFDSFVCSILIQLQIFSTNDWPAIMENLALDYEPKFFVYTYFIGCFIIINMPLYANLSFVGSTAFFTATTLAMTVAGLMTS